MKAEKIDISKAIPEGAVGRVTMKDAGYIDVKDETIMKSPKYT